MYIHGGDVMIGDQNSDIVDYYMCISISPLELSALAPIEARTIEVVDGSGVVNGTYVCMQEGSRSFQAKVMSGGGTNTLTLDTPLDYEFGVCTIIENKTPDLNVVGSTSAEVLATLKPNWGVKWDITRVIMSMVHASSADDGKFGGIDGLTNGIILRKSNGEHHTIFNAKTNGELRERMYDVSFNDKAPAGAYGTTCRRTFAGQDKNGVTIRLDGSLNESLDILIQDDLSGLTSFRSVAQGHVVED